MNDLVKRLRDCSKNTTDRYMHELTGRAADHIEALEAEIDEIHATGGCSYSRLEAANKRIAKLQARLDAFLEVYAAANQGTALVSNQGQAMDGFTELANYRAAAKAALGEQE